MKYFIISLVAFMVAFAPFQAHSSSPPVSFFQCSKLIRHFNVLTDQIKADHQQEGLPTVDKNRGIFRANTNAIRQQTTMIAMVALKCHEYGDFVRIRIR